MKIRPVEAESEGCGGPTVEDDNEERPDLRRNPERWGQFLPFRRRSKILHIRRFSLLELRKIGSQRRPWKS
jgi:hypothetical protein